MSFDDELMWQARIVRVHEVIELCVRLRTQPWVVHCEMECYGPFMVRDRLLSVECSSNTQDERERRRA